MQAAGFLEMLRVIREVEPPRPSTKLSKSGTLPFVADVRRTDPQKLVSLMRGELDWIILKCLEKDRGRRYQAASGLAQRAWEENNVVRARELLAQLPTEAAGRNLRGFEWFYVSRLCDPDELATLEGHTNSVTSVAFSPDGQRLASGSSDKTVKIWDSATGQELFDLKGHAATVSSVAFSPDGLRLASASRDKSVKIWDSATGKELLALKGHTDVVVSVTFSPDGQRLASGSGDQTVKIWDSATGKELSRSRAIPVRSGAWCSARTASAWRRGALTRR